MNLLRPSKKRKCNFTNKEDIVGHLPPSTSCNTFYPEGPSKSDSFSRIASEKHFDRLDELLKKTRGTIVLGGETDSASKYIAPTVVKDVERDDPLMSEEIFGPILPILPMKDLDEAIGFVQTLYVCCF